MRLWVSLLGTCVACYAPTPLPGSPCSTTQPCPSGLVCSPATRTCDLVAVDAAVSPDVTPDAFVPVVGSGTVGSPYEAVAGPPTSCAAFLASYPLQAGRDGLYTIKPGGQLEAYCDMTTDQGGWTLVARVLSSSATHATASPLGTLTGPAQATTAKLADATINGLAFGHARFVIETAGTFYTRVSALDLAGATFGLANTAAPTFAGPYTFDFLTQTNCGSDCGVSIIRPSMGFGNNCGFQYYADANNARPGMGCQGDPTNDGTVWVR